MHPFSEASNTAFLAVFFTNFGVNVDVSQSKFLKKNILATVQVTSEQKVIIPGSIVGVDDLSERFFIMRNICKQAIIKNTDQLTVIAT